MLNIQQDLYNEIISVRRNLQDKFAKDKTSEAISVIYHYTSPEGLLGILTTKKLWFSNIKYLNDESEIIYTLDILKEYVYSDSANINQIFRENIKKNLDKSFQGSTNTEDNVNRKSLFVACFSTEKDNLSLWNYYTKTENIVGYNIGFNVNLLVNDIKSKLKKSHYFIHGKTICNKEKQMEYIKDAIEKFNMLYNKAQTNNEMDNILKSFWGLIHIFSLFFKTEAFKNENEYRFVITEYFDILQQNNRAFLIKHRIQNGIIIPYIEVEFSKNMVSTITTSPTIRQNYYKAGVESLLHQNEYFQTKVIMSEIPLRY